MGPIKAARLNRIFAVSICLAVIVGCGKPGAVPGSQVDTTIPESQPLSAVNSVDPSAAGNAPAGTYSPALRAAFLGAFGSLPPATITAADSDDVDESLKYEPDKIIPVEDVLVLVSLGSLPEGAAHAFPGTLAIQYLKQTGDRYVPVGRATIVTGGFGFGKAPKWTLRTDLLPNPLVLVEGGFSGMGCNAEYQTVVEIAKSGVTKSDDILKSYEFGDTTVTSEVSGNKDGDGFDVTYRGAVSRTVPYVRVDERWVPTKKIDDLPVC